MRIVEYQPETKSLSVRGLKALGIASGIFSIVLFSLLMANYVSLKLNDPIHAPALIRLTEELKGKPQNEALKEQIRDLDYLARRAFFNSQHFTQLATWLLLGSVVATLVAFKALATYHQRFPYPNPHPPKEDLAANAAWARKAVTAAGLVLGGLALSLALPWNSPLDQVERPALSAGARSSTEKAPVSATPAAAYASTEDLAKNWPVFLGIRSGHANSTNLPTAWDGSSGQEITWKTKVPKPGFGSPIIWNDRIFLSGADEQEREVYCFSVEKGALLWKQAVGKIPGSPAELPKVGEDTGYAASTMATDGSRVFAIFANGDLVALDFDGRSIWTRNLGLPDNPYGYGSSLAVYKHLVLVQFDQNKGGAVYGIDGQTGEIRWKTPREVGISWASPLLADRDGRAELILSAAPAVISYHPETGKELWRVACSLHGEVAPSPVYGEGLVYVSADNGSLVAIDPTKNEIAWKQDDSIPGVCTALVTGKYLIYGLNDGGIVCRDAKTGQEVWQQETDTGFYASPLLAGDRVYLIDRHGQMYIFPAADKFSLLASPKIGEPAVATPAVIGNSLILRGTQHLFRIGT